jgi:tRNA (guanine-N7-)-methyltransferase
MHDNTRDKTAPERARFFGRTRGKTLRQMQAGVLADGLARFAITLPDGLLDLHALFPTNPRALRLEVGFGGGEHLVHRAIENPDVGFIGVEPFVNGMAKLMMEVEGQGLTNIRVFGNDATMLLRRLPEACLEEVALLYPDPWPKRRQRKRRFVSEEALSLIARALQPGGIFRFASDIDDYVGWTLARILPMPDFIWHADTTADWTTPYPGWPGTRYEAKALREGRVPSYLRFTRR